MAQLPKIAIIIVSYHSEPYWDNILTSLKSLTYSREQLELIIVDNPHPEHGPSFSYLEKNILPLSGSTIPHVTILPQKENLGFAGGNNIGIQKALELGVEYIFLHNQDGFLAPDCLEKLIVEISKDNKIGAVQPLILLYPEKELVNSSGNKFHYLGFGFCGDYRRPLAEIKTDGRKEIFYGSGAALLLRSDVIRELGMLDGDLISYHEDLEYGLRLRYAGYRTMLATEARFFHQYSFSRNAPKFYLMERNRYAVLCKYYSWWTLLLLTPIFISVEIGSIFLSIVQGWFGKKLSAWGYWCRISSWKIWLTKRHNVRRILSDKAVLRLASDKIVFENFGGWPIRFGNIILAIYWKIIYHLL